MLYRPYGTTGKQISIISAGGMRYSKPQDIDAMAQIPLEAARLGINYFDTAPLYCEDMSETILGAALKEIKKEGHEHYISTKSNANTYDDMMRSIEKSMRIMDVDHIHFMHCWCLLSIDAFEKRERLGAIKALQEAKESGLISHVVFSSHMSGEDIAVVADSGLFEGVTLGFCAINFPFRMEGIKAAYRNNMGVITMNPLGGGQIIDHADRFCFIKTSREQSVLEAALHFNLAHKEVSSALVGFTTVEDVRSAVATVDTFKPLTEEEIGSIREKIEDGFNQLCTTCNYCKDCPEKIPVAKLMEAFNYYILYNDPQKVFERLKWHWNVPDLSVLEKCIECRQCEESCTQKLPILERFEKLKVINK